MVAVCIADLASIFDSRSSLWWENHYLPGLLQPHFHGVLQLLLILVQKERPDGLNQIFGHLWRGPADLLHSRSSGANGMQMACVQDGIRSVPGIQGC